MLFRSAGTDRSTKRLEVQLDATVSDDGLPVLYGRVTCRWSVVSGPGSAKFADPDVPYSSLVHPMWSTHYGTYDHLARVKEWSLTGGADGDGGGA